jgi:alpha-galactosidase
MSIALSAVSGGMFEIGDDLPTLGASPERLALVKNADLLDVARLGRAATPIDLLSYEARDLQPSIFLMVENRRQALLTIFNWTDAPRTRAVDLAQLGLRGNYRISDVFSNESCCELSSGKIELTQKPRSVRVIKLVDKAVTDSAPGFDVRVPARVATGDAATLEVQATSPDEPVLRCHWDFGDGTSADGISVRHTYTSSGTYQIEVTATGLSTLASHETRKLTVEGAIATRFEPTRNRR